MCDSRLSADDAHEQTSRMSTLDLYEDLLIKEDNEDGDRILSMPEILSEKHSLQEQNALLLCQLMEAKLEARKLEEEKVNLQKNFNNLLATAKVELERKNGLLSRYVGGSGAPITRPTSTSSHISKEHARPSSKKKGLLELYKGRRVDENELTALSMSSGPVMPHTTISSPALLQSRGEKMVGVATRVIGSSFENIRAATSNTSINLSSNQQASARMLDSEGQNTQPKGRMSNPIEELVQVSSNVRHSANDIFRSISPKSRHPSKFEKRMSRFRVERSHEINELGLNPNIQGRIRPNDISTASSSEVVILSTSEDTNGRMNTPADVAPKMGNNNETITTPKSLDVRLTRRDSNTIADRDRIQHSSKSRNDIAKRSSKLKKDQSPASKSSSSKKHSKSFESNNHKNEQTSFKEGTPRNRTSTTKDTLDHEKMRPYDEGRRGIDPREAMYSGSSAVSRHSEKDRERRNSERRTSTCESQSKDTLGKTELSPRYTGKNRIIEKRQHRKTEERERCSLANEKAIDQKKRSESSSRGAQKIKSEKMKKSSGLREKKDNKYQVSPKKSPRKPKMDATRGMNRDRKSTLKDEPQQSKKSSSNPEHLEMKRPPFKDASIAPSTCSKVGFGPDAQIPSTEAQSCTHLNSTLEPPASRVIGSTELIEKPKLKQVTNFDYMTSARGVTIMTNRCETSLDSHPSLHKSNFASPGKSKAQNPMKKAPQRKSPRKATPTKKNMSNKAAPVVVPPVAKSPVSADVGNLSFHSQSATQIPEDVEYLDSPHLELDYNEDSLMYREIMQPDNADETNMPSDDANKENSAFEADKNDTASCSINQRSPVPDTAASIASSNLQISVANHHNSTSVPDRKSNMHEPQNTNISKSVDKGRLNETSNIVAISVSKYCTSTGISNVSQLASSPKYQPCVRLVDIKESAVDKGVKRKISYETVGEVPVKRGKLEGTDKLGKEKVRQDDKIPSKYKKLSDPRPINLKAKTDPLKAETLPSAMRQQDGLCCVVPPELKIQSNSNLWYEGTAGPDVSSGIPASTTFMDVGMEVEVETSPSLISEMNKKTEKKCKKHKLKIKIKPFKRNKGKKSKAGDTKLGKSLGDMETPFVSSASDPSDVLPGLNTVHHLPEASPVLSQWLDSAKKKKKHKRKAKERKQKSKKLIYNSKEKSVDIESTCNALETKDQKSEAHADNSRTKGEQAELVNAVASICGEGETTSTKHKNDVTLVFKSICSTQKNRAGNLMRSYSNAALKWLIRLGSERLKSLNGTTVQPLDLSLMKRQRSASIRSVTKEEHPTAIVNLFSEEPGNKTKSPPIDEIAAERARYLLIGTSTIATISQPSTENKALQLSQPGPNLDPITTQVSHRSCQSCDTGSIKEMQSHHGTSTLSSTVEGNRECFDNLLEKHTKKQKKEVLMRKDEVDKSQQPPVKKRKPRRVALERVEMPDPKVLASQSNDMVSPLSRYLWMTSLEKCQERRKKRARWSSELSEYHEAQGSSGLDEYDKVVFVAQKIPENANTDDADITRKVSHMEPFLPDSLPAFQKHIQPTSRLHKSCQLPDHNDAASRSSLFSVGDLSSSSWRLSEESRCRLYSFAKAVQVLSPFKSSPSRVSPVFSSF